LGQLAVKFRLLESETMKIKTIISVAAIIGMLGVTGCKPKTTTQIPHQTNQTTVEPAQSSAEQTNLKPVAGAFGYKLGDKLSGEIDDYTPLRDSQPFTGFSINTNSDGRICQITAMGTVEESDLYDDRKRLISVLTEKYGARGKMGAEKYALDLGSENFYFGTTNRLAYLVSGRKLLFFDVRGDVVGSGRPVSG
jgi:hypothetical protein